MGISSVSLESQLANLATGMQAEQVGLQIAVAVMKSIQDQQEMQANALIQMIQQTPSPDPAIGQNLDIQA